MYIIHVVSYRTDRHNTFTESKECKLSFIDFLYLTFIDPILMPKNRSILIVFFLVCGCICFGQAKKLTLQLKWWHQFQFAGYYAAQTHGYYARQGLDVTLLPGDVEHPAIDEVLSGRASFGITGCDLLTAYALGKPLVALGAIFQHSPYIIISSADKHILSPADLIGKTIMASENQGWVELRAMILKEGIAINQIHVVTHSWNNRDLVNGKVDAITGYRSVEPYQLAQMGMTTSVIQPATYGVDFYGDVLFASRSFVDRNPETTEKFRQASFEGWEYALSHKEELCNYILTLPGVKERKVTKEALLYEANEMEKLILPQLVEIGHMNEGRWRHIRDVQYSLGIIPANKNLKEFIYTKKAGFAESFKTLWVWILAGVAVVFLLVLAYSMMVRRTVLAKTKVLRETLDELKISEEALTEKNKELKKLSAYLQHIREDERKHIAREVHDVLGQLASVIKIDLDWLDTRLPSTEETAKTRINHAINATGLLLTSIRKIASGLRPSILDDFGLNAAIKWQCDEFTQLTGIPCTTSFGFDDSDLSGSLKTELFRIIQESLTNIMRHAAASEVTIFTSEDKKNLFITIEDNGKGFNTSQPTKTLGLVGLRERAQSLNGSLTINSRPGVGTTVHIKVPRA